MATSNKPSILKSANATADGEPARENVLGDWKRPLCIVTNYVKLRAPPYVLPDITGRALYIVTMPEIATLEHY